MAAPTLPLAEFSPETFPGHRVELGRETPLQLDCGVPLGPFTVAWQSWGELNADRSNAILVCHALTGDQFAAGAHPLTGREGWGAIMIGPGREIGRAHV